MPDHPNTPAAGHAACPAARFVAALFLGYPGLGALQLRRPQGLADSGADGVELVVAGHLLNQPSAAVVLKHDEVAEQGQ